MHLKLSYRPFRVKMAELNLSRKELEIATGINKNTIGRLYNDIDVSIDTLRKVCEFLECSVQNVVEFVPDMNELLGPGIHKGEPRKE
jgi:putative transcriptional regulator